MADSEGGAIGAISPLKLAEVTLFTMILYNSENSIRDIRPFCRPLICHNSVMCSLLHLSYSSEPVKRLDYQILLKLTPPNLTGWIRLWIKQITACLRT